MGSNTGNGRAKCVATHAGAVIVRSTVQRDRSSVDTVVGIKTCETTLPKRDIGCQQEGADK